MLAVCQTTPQAQCHSPYQAASEAPLGRSAVCLGEVRHESAPRTPNAHAASAAEVRGHDQQIIVDCILQQRTPNARSFEHVDASVGRQFGIQHLHWSVDRITAENCRRTAIRANAQLPGSVARQWQQCQAFGQVLAIIDEIQQPCLGNRQHAVFEARQLHPIADGVSIPLLPVFELTPACEVARLGKRRHPAAIVQTRVPTNMIDVQVRAEHEIH